MKRNDASPCSFQFQVGIRFEIVALNLNKGKSLWLKITSTNEPTRLTR